MSKSIEERMRTLLSEADSGAMPHGARLRAAMALVAEAWDEGREAGLCDYDDRMPDHTPNPYEEV